MNLLYNATTIPAALMFAAGNEQDMLCRIFGDCLAGDKLDREIGALIGEQLPRPVQEKLFTYCATTPTSARPALRSWIFCTSTRSRCRRWT